MGRRENGRNMRQVGVPERLGGAMRRALAPGRRCDRRYAKPLHQAAAQGLVSRVCWELCSALPAPNRAGPRGLVARHLAMPLCQANSPGHRATVPGQAAESDHRWLGQTILPGHRGAAAPLTQFRANKRCSACQQCAWVRQLPLVTKSNAVSPN